MINLRQDHLGLVQRTLAQYVPEYEVWVFGSRVTATAKRYSDLDLVILSPAPLPPRTRALLKTEFSESDLPFKVDVLDWATTTESFRRLIARQHDVVQQPTGGNPPAASPSR